MKYPFLFIFIAVLLATFFFVLVGAATFAEIKHVVGNKAKSASRNRENL